MVAPLNAHGRAQNSVPGDPSLRGNVCGLPGRVYAEAKAAPRQLLEGQQVSVAVVQDHLGKLTQYDGAFRLLWAILVEHKLDPLQCSLQQVAGGLISLHKVSPSQARNAYAAMLLVPGFSQLRFAPLLQPYRRMWNSSDEKYGTFWDPSMLVRHLAATPMNWDDVTELRDRLVICCKLLCLHRSCDLAHVLRTVSLVDGKPFMLLRRKGWKSPRWERVVSLPHLILPWHLMQ